ncbi:MAG TPA: glycosyltransferase [Jiangellales bacterium]|nr:glycosyltransferase [Jiangellales bacterium]
MSLERALRTVRDAPFVVDALRAADDLAAAAARDRSTAAVTSLVRAVHDPDDELTAVAAVHALARVFDDAADAELSDLLSHPRPFLREHAAWALSARLPRLDAVGRLVAVVAGGGFPGVLAQRTLERWSYSAPDHVALALEGALALPQDPAARARLVETLGLVPGPVAARAVRHVAAAGGEPPVARRAAVAGRGDRRGDPRAAELVRDLAGGGGELAAVARLAAYDLGLGPVEAPPATSGLSVAQLFLHADLDHELTRAGTGDNGGIATLLVRLGDALVAAGAERVLTLSRGSAAAAADSLGGPAEGHLLVPVPLTGDLVPAPQAWPLRVAVRRGLRRALTAHGRVDVVHLRMADVGSMAAAEVAAQLGIPVVFTLAPDPHAVIHALDMAGALTREGFGGVDEVEHYWFRARLVQRLAAAASHTVLFPRPELRHDLRELLGVDVDAEPRRHTVVPEGIDLAVTEAAETADTTPSDGARPPAAQELVALLAGLPAERHGLPVLITVGRLHRVKGMASVVRAWAGDDELRARCNLVIVGGDLDDPSADEQAELDRIHDVLAAPGAAGLVLAGHRPNAVVAAWLRAVHVGAGAVLAPGGAYVCGSLKEEFGIALLEALAAGLPVAAPRGGGPATYVEEGVTGVLVDTTSVTEIARGVHAVLDLAAAPEAADGARRARDLVRERFTVEGMASTLMGVYAGLTVPAAG